MQINEKAMRVSSQHTNSEATDMDAQKLADELAQRIQKLEDQNKELRDRVLALSHENRGQAQLIYTLLDRSPFGIVIFNNQRKLLRINKAAEHILGVERMQAIGQQCNHFFVCEQEESQCPIIAHGEEFDRIETQCANPSKSQTHLLRSTAYISNQSEDIILESFVDISEIKKAEQAKDDFTAKISHELRTPLNAILGYSELLREDLETSLDDEQTIYLGSIHRSGKDMLELVNRLLDFSQLTAKNSKLSVTEFEVQPLLDEIRNQIKPYLEQNSNLLEIQQSSPLSAITSDRFRLRQILINLLTNACKYSGNDTIILRVSTDTDKKTIQFEIIDHGIGMDKEQQERIFNAFEQADNSRTRSYDGVGLGLTIARETAHLLGGDISVTSELGKGSTFTLVLPITPV